MYSAVVLMALATSADVSTGHHRNRGCSGGYSSCYGGYANCYGGCNGCNGCYGYYGGGWSCYGGYSNSCCGTYHFSGNTGYYGVPSAPADGVPMADGTVVPEMKDEKKSDGDKKDDGDKKGDNEKKDDGDKKSDKEARRDAPATILVQVANDATITLDGSPTNSKSTTRLFVTPPLAPGFDYVYNLRASVNRDGSPRFAAQTVNVRAGEQTRVDLRSLSTSDGVAQR